MKLRNEMAIMKILNFFKVITKIELLCVTGGVAAYKPAGALLIPYCCTYVLNM